MCSWLLPIPQVGECYIRNVWTSRTVNPFQAWNVNLYTDMHTYIVSLCYVSSIVCVGVCATVIVIPWPSKSHTICSKTLRKLCFLPFQIHALWGLPFVSPKKLTEMHFQKRDLYKKNTIIFCEFPTLDPLCGKSTKQSHHDAVLC